MSARYEIPEPEEAERRQAVQDEQWRAIAETATKDDPGFQRWKKRYWTKVWCTTGLVFCLVFLGVFALHQELIREDRERNRTQDPRYLKLYGYPLALAGAVQGIGGWIYRRKLRSIAVREWSEQRAAEFASRRKAAPTQNH